MISFDLDNDAHRAALTSICIQLAGNREDALQRLLMMQSFSTRRLASPIDPFYREHLLFVREFSSAVLQWVTQVIEEAPRSEA